MPKSRFDSDLEDYEDPDEATLHDFWETWRQGEGAEHVAAAKKKQAPVEEDLDDLRGRDNPRCPDSSSHEQNAYDDYYEKHGEPQTGDDWEAVDRAFLKEFHACEGHN